MNVTVTVAELLLAFVPGLGGPIACSFMLLRELCVNAKDGEVKFQQVLGRIERFYVVLQSIHDAGLLQRNPVLKTLETTILKFKSVMVKYPKKNIVSRFFTHSELDAQILSFHSDIDGLFQMLSLLHIAESGEWRRRFEENQTRDHTLLTNVYGMLKMCTGRTERREAMMLMGVGISGKNTSRKFTKQDVPWMEQTQDAMAKYTDLPIEQVPSWYLPSEDVTCPDAKFDVGTYGSVHRGTWNGTPVVIKKLLLTGEQIEQPFLREANVWSLLNHPRVVKLYGACHLSSPLFFVCEDATKGNFADFFKLKDNKQQLWRRFHEPRSGSPTCTR